MTDVAVRLALGDDLLMRLRQALETVPGRAVIIDLSETAAVEPAALRLLRRVAEEAAAMAGGLYLTGASPEVYKALHVAGIAQRFQRA